MMQLRKAEKQKTKLRIGLSGVSGSGKTKSGLFMARGMASAWNKVAIIDTENGSADLYSNMGDYNVITISAPFTPEKYIEAIHACEQSGMEVIIIDSVTHVWKGEGGLLEYNQSIGGRFQDWAKTTPRYQKWLGNILNSTCHVITTNRKKTAFEMIKDEKGSVRVEKKGLDDEIRDGFDYELTLVFDISQKHLAVATKDRTGIFMDNPEFIITEETGKTLMKWANDGSENKPSKMPVDESKVSTMVGGAQNATEATIGSNEVPQRSTGNAITKAQQGKIYGLYQAKGLNSDAMKLVLKARYGVDSHSRLTVQNASDYITYLLGLKDIETANDIFDGDLPNAQTL